jgi:hypothetical protein
MVSRGSVRDLRRKKGRRRRRGGVGTCGSLVCGQRTIFFSEILAPRITYPGILLYMHAERFYQYTLTDITCAEVLLE